MPTLVRIKNWDRYQHYKDRNPPWFKMYTDLLTSNTWICSDDASRALAIALMVLASKTQNKIPASEEYLKRVAYLNATPNLQRLVELDFIELVEDSSDASAVLARRYQVASTEKRREEKSREEKTNGRAFALPEWVPVDNWEAWLEVRKKLKVPNTPRSLLLAVKSLDKLRSAGNDPAAVLDQSTERGWRGLFELKKPVDSRGQTVAEPPSIVCQDCGKRTYTWTGHRCDPCWKTYMNPKRERHVAANV